MLSHQIEEVPTHVRGLPGSRVLRLERLRLVDHEPLAFIRTWLPAELKAVLPVECLVDASLHEQLRLRAGAVVSGGPRRIQAVAAPPPIAALLKVKKGSPLLLLEGESRDQDGRVVEVFSTWHRSDKVAFELTVEPPERRGRDPRGGRSRPAPRRGPSGP